MCSKEATKIEMKLAVKHEAKVNRDRWLHCGPFRLPSPRRANKRLSDGVFDRWPVCGETQSPFIHVSLCPDVFIHAHHYRRLKWRCFSGSNMTDRKTTDPSVHPPGFDEIRMPNPYTIPPARLRARKRGKQKRNFVLLIRK
ncbi:hypothetical protein CGRA01v4_06185 [Colletotrichum graminicola]|nr:hypothetical protein CGRA01v4_06185 [Colletotrichum graminicola]